ncbi:uncharacterized protein LOC105380980 isoform X1 [Plutella xylostella]|uniref:uncharacterized protein LOC105380980 isoform X1 n=1 Tax=Plutella xylostella TaxID=51655 RepID=UPI002032C203|nr:uncharacterized protein LOC105380980 isoform X1 [Plutella xylostella]
MDDKQESEDKKDDESTNSQDATYEKKNSEQYIKRIKDIGLCPMQDGAGPSKANESLPGSTQTVPKTFLIKPGLSKSEQNIRHIFTTEYVSDAIRVARDNIKLHKTDDPLVKNQKDIPAALELSDLVVSICSKLGPFNEISVTGVNNVTLVDENVDCSSIVTNNLVQTDIGLKVVNQVIVTHPEEPKIPKYEPDAASKKKDGSLASDFPTQRDSLSSIGSNVCRICMTKGRERLISPCNCKGSLANVHLTCLERWLNQVGRNHCELCGYSYPAIRTPRYTVLQALRLWFGNPRNRSHLQSDCLIFWLLSTVTAGLLAVCVVGTQYFVIEGTKYGKHGLRKQNEGISHRITETAMDFFMALVLCGYSVTVYLLWKDHYVMWNRWRRANVNVRLLLGPDATPVPFVPRPNYHVV